MNNTIRHHKNIINDINNSIIYNIRNKPPPINICKTRFAKCNINKKINFSSGNVIIYGAPNYQRISYLVQQSKFRHGQKPVFVKQQLNAYGRTAGGPGGFGASPSNKF